MCVERDDLRQRSVAARADYGAALTDLQHADGDLRNALSRANRAFSDWSVAQSAFDDHVLRHGCLRGIEGPLTPFPVGKIPVLPITRTRASARSRKH